MEIMLLNSMMLLDLVQMLLIVLVDKDTVSCVDEATALLKISILNLV